MNNNQFALSSFREQLCGCFNDMFSCLIAFQVPCGGCLVHSMATNQITNTGFLRACVLSVLFCCFGMAHNRQEVKRRLAIPQSYWSDCLAYFCCMNCAASQDSREAEGRYLENP